MSPPADSQRHIGLLAAIGIGVGAIVGGGILALAGVAFAETGSGAFLAFALNGVIALVTAMSFAELATAFPHSGGPYVFAKRVLTVGTAFLVGWIVWFASIQAAVLYAVGFAAFALEGAAGSLPDGVSGPWALTTLAALATIACTLAVARSPAGGGNAVNVAKVVVFGVLIVGGVVVWAERGPSHERAALLPHGPVGLLRAMGYTFIALQGFDLIAAVAGEVKDPRRTVPRAMFAALAIALAIYLPLLVIVVAVGVPQGRTLAEFVSEHPETVLAEAARNYLGESGYWLVIAAGVLSMLSALLANVYAASRIARAMGRDRTLPTIVERTHARLGTPAVAAGVTAAIALAILVAVGDVASAGAASSLSFLLAFALANVLCVVVRRRKPGHGGFRVPLWPALPVGAAVLCTALAVFQGVVVPAAGLVVGGWLAIGVLAYLFVFASRARVRDAVSEVLDADLLELRGRSPLVLVPVTRGSDPGVLALLAACVSPPRVGRVLLLNVVPRVTEEFDREVPHSAALLRDSLSAAVHAGARTEALATQAHDPWEEYERVARVHRCATLLIGTAELSDEVLRGRLEWLASHLTANLIVARLPEGWRPEDTERVLVPIRGGTYGSLRARMLASLRHRAAPQMEVVYLLVLPTSTTERQRRRAERSFEDLMRSEVATSSSMRSVLSDDPSAAIAEQATGCDLLVLGLSRVSATARTFGPLIRKVVAATDCAAMILSERR